MPPTIIKNLNNSFTKSFFTVRLFLFLFVFHALPIALQAGERLQDPIVLRVATLPFIPTEFYIEDFVDQRQNTSAVAWLIPPGNLNSKTQAVDLSGGGRAAVENFVYKSLPRNKNLRPVIVRLQEFRVQEVPGEQGLIHGELSLKMAFDLKSTDENHHLVTFQGGMRYKRSANHQFDLEPGMRKSLVNALEYLNQWMDKNVASHPLLAKEVKVIFSDYIANPEEDTVYYSPDRPLVWDDFRAPPRANKYAASIFPSFSWTASSEVVDGVIHYHLETKVYMLKNSSWVRKGVANAYGLNHEQRHFDIVKIVVERFKRRLAEMPLSPENYDDMLGYQYIETYREMNQLQDQYDGETNHGINTSAQEKWNRWIDGELEKIFEE
jgi:hypothetical protein